METDPTRMCELLVGLPEVNVLGIEELIEGPLLVHIEARGDRPGCSGCGVFAQVKDRPIVELVDLAAFGRQTRPVWHKFRWCCPEPTCPVGSWTEENPAIGAPRMLMTDRAGRWVPEQVGRGRYRRQEFSTSIVDVAGGQLLDVVPGRGAKGPTEWLEWKGQAFCSAITVGTLDLSGPYRSVFEAMAPEATLVADPFHVVRHANTKLDECRRRVQTETLGHRGRKHDPLYRARRLLTKAEERLEDSGREKLLGLLRAGDPKGQVATAWHAKEAVRELYAHADESLATEWLERLVVDMADTDNPIEVRSLGRTLARWQSEICAWHATFLTNGPTEAMNNLIKRVKRGAFGLTNFLHYRIRALLYAGKPNWDLLATVTPR